MTDQDVKIQTMRIGQYSKLEAEMRAINTTFAILDMPIGIYKASAFTGNARESRQIVNMRIELSATIGKESPVELTLPNLNVSASRVGSLLREMLTERLKAVREAMEAL